jgi:hypothetical protein
MNFNPFTSDKGTGKVKLYIDDEMFSDVTFATIFCLYVGLIETSMIGTEFGFF